MSAQANLDTARAGLSENARMELAAASSRVNAMCNPSYERFAASHILEASLASLVGEIEDPLVLGALYWECSTRGHNADRQSDSDVHFVARMRIVDRLAKIGTKEAAATLVGLLGREAVCDGEVRLTFGEAITTLGNPCLPYLEELLRGAPGRRNAEFVERLRRMIQEGEILGP